MTILNVSLPDKLKRIVDQRVAEGAFANHDAYLRALIVEDERRREKEQVEEKLLKRLRSLKRVPWTGNDTKRIRTRVLAELERRRKSGGSKKI